jgi:hypothetical protein
MEPLRVTAVLAEPVVYFGDGMHFDGILSWGAFAALSPEAREALPSIGGPTAVDFDMPLARWKVGDVWGWRASAAHAEWLADTKVEVRKRPPQAEMARYTTAGSVQINCGSFKAQDKAFPARVAREVVWYAVGERPAVEALLAFVPHIGKLSRHGNGRVLEWRVDQWAPDWAIERDGALTRRMPAAYRPDEVPGRGGLRAPYHHLSRQGPCVEPDFMALRP